ncbi:hypothetical protein SDC9_204735 [bioreactor metagenome]|uniref:Uncharacterized protein n=1 Tax=bioreactor metagenome TaxID=1076179 RepID=A0A645J0D5_9ZZZZ
MADQPRLPVLAVVAGVVVDQSTGAPVVPFVVTGAVPVRLLEALAPRVLALDPLLQPDGTLQNLGHGARPVVGGDDPLIERILDPTLDETLLRVELVDDLRRVRVGFVVVGGHTHSVPRPDPDRASSG